MPELKMISPLLDQMQVEKEFSGHNGRISYAMRHTGTKERFILKVLSVPASDSQVRALILSGAYPNEAAVHVYYGRVVSDIRSELSAGKKLAASGCFVGSVDYQILPKESGVGYDIYILYPLFVPLDELLAMNAITNLRAVNLGLDLCDSIAACREAGYLFGNLKPENIFLMQSGRFLLGDLGLVTLQDLKYACLPEEYIGPYSAPELSDITACPNLTVDIYSLGMVLYRIYNGNHGPFEDENTGEGMADKLRMTGKPLPTPIYADYELASIILKACAFRREDRYQTPQELKQALTMYMQRNEISDTLIVPPIISPQEPLAADAQEELPQEPVRMTNAEQLDENFRHSFSPDLSGAGTEADIDKNAAMGQPQEAAKAKAVPPEVSVQVSGTPDAEAAMPSKEAAQPETDTASSEVDTAKAETDPPKQEIDAAKQTEAEESGDATQLSIDELLASVNQAVNNALKPEAQEHGSTAKDASVSTTLEYVDVSPDEAEEIDTEEKSHGKIGRIALIVALVLAICTVGYFLLAWYFVGASAVNVISCNTEEITVELVTNDDADKFSLSCTDSYGKSYPLRMEGNLYVFYGLSEKTTYTVRVSAADMHALTSRSVKMLTRTTPESTRITDFAASRGDKDGEVALNFNSEGPTPEHWVLSYYDTADAANKKEFDFDGNSFLVSGLLQNHTYRFTLGAVGDIYLSGETELTYDLLPFVEATELNISEIDDHSVTLVWKPGENLPDQWKIVCDGEDFHGEYTTKEAAVKLADLPDFDRDYTISVSAPGMDRPETITFPANPIVIEALTATANENGSVTLNWQTPAGKPTGGWYVSYNTVGSYHKPYMPDTAENAITENTVTLTGLIPDAEYEFSIALTAEDASLKIFGETSVTVKTAATGSFDSYGVTPKTPLNATDGYISVWKVPDAANWNYTDLTDHRTEFKPDEKIAICMEITGANPSEDQVVLTYAVRNAEGTVVNDVSSKLSWNSMWYSRRHASAIPMPVKNGSAAEPGSYTLEVYVNSRLLAKAPFTIVAAA